MTRRTVVVFRTIASLAAVGAVTVVFSSWPNVSPTTVALTYLVVILIVATAWTLVEAIAASIVAVLCLNFFFLPPVGTLTIADPQNWVALFAFLVTTVVAAIGLTRVRADKATAQAEALQESSELRAAVVDALAHEFKTPLTAIKAASSTLITNPSPNSDDRELLAVIDEEVDRLGRLVTDAVHMLRIEAGDFTLHVERQPARALVERVVQSFERRLEGHTLTLKIPDGLVVDADGTLLALSLRQLLDNALKYSPALSAIDITVLANAQVTFTVHNTGSVVSAWEQPRVFERFYRGNQARRIPGTGMGLAIVQQIARAHGGSLSVSSSEGSGTSFTLSLPQHGDRT